MEISIRKSKKMTEVEPSEDKYIRLSSDLLKTLSLDLGDYIYLDSKNGEEIELETKYLHDEDNTLLLNTAFVSDNVYDKILLLKKTVKRVENLLIGCDPEFFLVHRPSKRVIPGQRYFTNASNRQVGVDGALMELRPHPNINSTTVANNLHKLLLQAKNKVYSNKGINSSYKQEDIYMLGTSYYDKMSAGFHIHFGIPPKMLDTGSDEVRTAISHIANILDYYVGIPAIFPEPVIDSHRRTDIEISYGKPGDWRLQFPTFEYRVPGGFMLSSPTLTKGLLSLSWVVMDDILARIKICTDDFNNIGYLNSSKIAKQLYPNLIVDRLKLCGLMCNYNPKNMHKIVEDVFKDVEEMISFEKEKKQLINFYNCITSGVANTHNIEENWRLYNEFEKVEFHTVS